MQVVDLHIKYNNRAIPDYHLITEATQGLDMFFFRDFFIFMPTQLLEVRLIQIRSNVYVLYMFVMLGITLPSRFSVAFYVLESPIKEQRYLSNVNIQTHSFYVVPANG